MCRFHIARHGVDDLFLFVDDDIDDIGKPRAARRPHHVPMDGVALQYACARKGAVNELGAMVGEHSRARADAGEHALTPA